MWVRILAATMVLVSLSKTLDYKWVPVRVEVDIVFEKASEALRYLRAVYSQGVETEYRNDIGPMTRGNTCL